MKPSHIDKCATIITQLRCKGEKMGEFVDEKMGEFIISGNWELFTVPLTSSTEH